MTKVREATKRQLYAVFCITGIDYRDKGMTFDEASEIIQKSHESGYQKKPKSVDSEDLLGWLKADKTLHEKILEQFGVESVIVTAKLDGSIDKNQPVYNFIGGGCGFSWFEFDKRSKLLKNLDEDQQPLMDAKSAFRNWFIKEYFTNEQVKSYEAKGTPVAAVLWQDMAINHVTNISIANCLVEKYGVKKSSINVRCRYD